MLFMTSITTGATHRAMLANQKYFGRFYTPKGKDGGGDLGLWDRWCLDNGAFTGYSESMFFDYLERMLPYRATCQFVVVPDVPFHWNETLEKFLIWQSRIKRLGFSPALAVQDGATVENVPFAMCDAIFVAGSTEWKRNDQFNALPLFRDVAIHPRDQIIQEAKRRGLWVHVGRSANGQNQLWSAYHMGADSIDGTCETFAPHKEFLWISQTMFDIHQVKEKGNGGYLLASDSGSKSQRGGIRKRSRDSKRFLAYSA